MCEYLFCRPTGDEQISDLLNGDYGDSMEKKNKREKNEFWCT